MRDYQELIAVGRKVLHIEAEAIMQQDKHLDEIFALCCQAILECKGKIIVSGLGKSGHIGNKIAATLASTGTPAFFLHPAEALHGDLGMLADGDLLLVLSNSGATDEVVTMLKSIRQFFNITVLAITSDAHSKCAQLADLHLKCAVEQEACVLGLAPTASTAALLALGDALAMTVLQARGFTKKDFAKSHPAGNLGKQLTFLAKDVMHTGSELPLVTANTSLAEAVVIMSSKHLGLLLVVESVQSKCKLLGIFTDGDLRRALVKHGPDLDWHNLPISQLMIIQPITVFSNASVVDILKLMRRHKISSLAVVDDDNYVVGALNMNDLLQLGVV